LIPTVLEIFGFELEGINLYHGPSLFQDISDPRKFLSRGIRINMVGPGLENKMLWHSLPADWLSDAS
jgi:hypothetical protein